MAPADRGPFISGVVLAAGTATRMGRVKQILPLAGRPLLRHVIDAALGSSLAEVIVVLGHRAAEVEAAVRIDGEQRLRFVTNHDYASGQGSSLRVGLDAVDPSAVAAAVLLADQPGVTPNLIDRVIEQFGREGRPVVRPAYLARGRRVPGHPVLLDRRIWGDLDALRGDEGVRAVLAQHPGWLSEVLIEGELPRDVDTVEDYESLAAESAPVRPG